MLLTLQNQSRYEKNFFFLITTITLIAACHKEELNFTQDDIQLKNAQVSYCLNKKDALLEAFNFFKKPITKVSESSIGTIELSGETVAYYVNHPDGGWALVSADKRTQTILAFNESGTYEESSIQGPARFWFNEICSDLYALKQDTTILTDSPHLAKWAKREAVKSAMTKGDGNEHENEWLQLVYTERETIVASNIPHLMSTHWGQGSPWNSSVPYYQGTDTRCYTGSSTTALAQLMYYLHYEINKPTGTPISSSATGSYPGNCSVTISELSYSSSVWNNFPLTQNDISSTKPSIYVASLMAKIGIALRYSSDWPWFHFVGTCYGTEFGDVTRASIKEYIEDEGIECEGYSNFNPSTIANSILRDMPVLAIAWNSSYGNDGYCWLVDGVQINETYDTYYNQWMPYGTFPPVEPEEPDWDHLEDYVISDPVLVSTSYFFRMNWGWDGFGDNTMYYYGDTWSTGNGYTLPSTRKILYDFQ